MLTGSPLRRISPASAGRAPDRTRISVDLPAPLPPTTPTTSPAYRSMVTLDTAWTPPNATLMLRISTSGVRSVTVTVVAPLRSASAPAVERVDADGKDEDDAGDDVLAGRVDAHVAQPVGEGLHEEATQNRARDRDDAAREGGPTHDGGRDDVQLVALADVERGAVQPCGRYGRREGAQDAPQDVGLQDQQPGVAAGELRGIRVAAEGIDVSPEPAAGGQPGHHQGHADQQDDREGVPDRAIQATREALGPHVGVGERGQAQDGSAAHDADHDLGPHRPERESESSSSPAAVEQEHDDRDAADHAQRPGQGAADRANGPPADELEVRVQAGNGGAAGEVPDDPADRQQPSERDDERRHADVGDDEALERPD